MLRLGTLATRRQKIPEIEKIDEHRRRGQDRQGDAEREPAAIIRGALIDHRPPRVRQRRAQRVEDLQRAAPAIGQAPGAAVDIGVAPQARHGVVRIRPRRQADRIGLVRDVGRLVRPFGHGQVERVRGTRQPDQPRDEGRAHRPHRACA